MFNGIFKNVVDRRQFALTSFASLFTGKVVADQGLTQSEEFINFFNTCKIQDIKQSEEAILIEDEKIYYWHEGLELMSRKHIVFYLDLINNKDSYTNKIVFTNGEKIALGATYLNHIQNKSLLDNRYYIFDNIDLNFSSKYFFLLERHEKGATKVYRYTLDQEKLKQSQFSSQKLPNQFLDLIKLLPKSDQIIGHYNFPVLLAEKDLCIDKKISDKECFKDFFPQAQILSLDEKGQFIFQFELKTLGYFSGKKAIFITDPVGRFIDGEIIESQTAQSLILKSASIGEIQTKWRFTSAIPSLINCPYIRIFWTIPGFGLIQNLIWFR